MDVIDHGIQIPASPERVWHIISDINRFPEWHVDCSSVAFLTSLRSGPGTRWRFVNKRGSEYVLEITSWYDRLGYEYRYVDGVSFKENRGMIRLQEVPEGTIVQWTFSYQPGGVFSRSSLGGKRAINNVMIDSLRTLYKYIARPGESKDRFEAKSLMRDAPDAEARARYVPRHPSTLAENESPRHAASAERYSFGTEPAPNIPNPPFLDPFYEPPIAQDDTRPRPAIHESIPSEPINITPFAIDEPDFIKDQPDSVFARRPSDTIKLDQPAPPPAAPTPPGTIDLSTLDTPDEAIPLSSSPEIPRSETVDLSQEPLPWKVSTQAQPTENLPYLPHIPESDPETDTSKVSVFELFGLPKPSETQEMRTVNAESSASEMPPRKTDSSTIQLSLSTPPSAPMSESAFSVQTSLASRVEDSPSPHYPGRIGLRQRQRRQLVKLRRPS